MKNIILLIIFIMLSILPCCNFADDTTDLRKVGATICDQINRSNEAYQNDDLNNAHFFILIAYFKWYDAYIEPPLRKKTSSKHIFAVEQQFRDLSNNMTPNPTNEKKQTISMAAQTLCDTVMADVRFLTTPG